MQCVTPFYVATSMSGIRRSSFMTPDGVSYTREAVATIGIKRVTYGCLSHTIQVRTSLSEGEKNCISSIEFDLSGCIVILWGHMIEVGVCFPIMIPLQSPRHI